jgi:hypothetical protein
MAQTGDIRSHCVTTVVLHSTCRSSIVVPSTPVIFFWEIGGV